MISKPLSLIIALAFVLCACGANGSTVSTPTTIPDFFTATLPITSISEPALTPPPPTPLPTIPPIEGTTTTQVNVRAEPSTNSAALGTILPSSKVLILGKDASGTWYQLLFAEGKGWVIAAYVQVTAGVDVPVIQVGTGSESSASVLAVQRVNVRSGPGTQFETIGILSPNDVVALTGKDPSGAWLQIEFASAPEARGWINAGFVQASGVETVPILAVPSPPAETGTPAEASPTTIPASEIAIEDGDSADAPSVTITFSPAGARVLQFSDEVSFPQGDLEDWVQVTPYGKLVEIQVSCAGSNELLIELWQGEAILETKLACEEIRILAVEKGKPYSIHFLAIGDNSGSFTQYTVKIEDVR